jgi:hypothetical protein
MGNSDPAARSVDLSDSATRASTDLAGAPCVVSVAEHAGWAHLVCVATSASVPVVIDRRRVTLIGPGLPTMPYHHESIGMPEAEANALIARVRASIATHAAAALQRLVTELAPTHPVVALAIRQPTYPELPRNVADVWKSYQLQCAADGMMYQLAICHAARDLHLAVHEYRRGQGTVVADEHLGATPDDIDAFVSRTGRPSGPPWTQEHRRAYAAGITALARHAPGNITIPARAC